MDKTELNPTRLAASRARSIGLAMTVALGSSTAAEATIISPSDLGQPTIEALINLPAATFQDGNGGVYKEQSTFGTISGSFTSTDGGTATAQATTSANQAASVNLGLTAGSDPVFGIDGNVAADLSYAMYIASPTDQSVQVHIDAKGGATITNTLPQSSNTQLQSQLLIQGVIDNFSLGFGQNLNRGYGSDLSSFSWSTDQDYTFQTNQRYDVSLKTEVESGTNNSGVANLSAFVDPLFTIDEPNASQYQLVFSEGISDTGGVPEPSTWAILLLGFAGVGLLTRRQRSGGVRVTR